MKEFCAAIADIIDVNVLKETDVLADFETWDSLSVLAVIAMLDAQYGVNVNALSLKNVRTVAGLWDLVEAKKKVSK